MEKFMYSKAIPVRYWGCGFDSLLELKFTLSIRDQYEFIRSPVSIYYDPRTRLPTNYIRDYIRRYTPDFLIRHKLTKEASLIEVKPGAFRHQKQLEIRKEVAENYIRWKNYDWKFKIVYDDQIELSPKVQDKLERSNKLFVVSKGKIDAGKIGDRFDRNFPDLFMPPSNQKLHFVMLGIRK